MHTAGTPRRSTTSAAPGGRLPQSTGPWRRGRAWQGCIMCAARYCTTWGGGASLSRHAQRPRGWPPTTRPLPMRSASCGAEGCRGTLTGRGGGSARRVGPPTPAAAAAAPLPPPPLPLSPLRRRPPRRAVERRICTGQRLWERGGGREKRRSRRQRTAARSRAAPAAKGTPYPPTPPAPPARDAPGARTAQVRPPMQPLSTSTGTARAGCRLCGRRQGACGPA